MRRDNFIPDSQVAVYRSRGRLPHWFVDFATYTVSLRLKDSLPRDIAIRLFETRAHLVGKARNDAERVMIERNFALQFDSYLDQGYGSCLFRKLGGSMASILARRDGHDYFLHAWCVMPNHLHTLLTIRRGLDLPGIVNAWKGVFSHENRTGPVWQREYFDRIVRSPEEFEREAIYIRRNPDAAGLKDWKWVSPP
jgi:hypothetical protein